MKLLTAIISPGDLDELLSTIHEFINTEDLVFDNIKILEEHHKAYTYRGKRVNDSAFADRLEVRCYVNKNNEKSMLELLGRFSGLVRRVDLEEAWDINTITSLDHPDVLIGFVIPAQNDLVRPLAKEILLNGYEVETLTSLPFNSESISRYDALVIDMSIKKYSIEELSQLLRTSAGVPLVLVNRSESPLDKIPLIRAGIYHVYEARDDHTLVASIVALASEHQEARRQLIRGSVDSLDSILSIMQLLSSQTKSGELSIVLENNSLGLVNFSEGRIIDAKYKNHEGEKAFFRIMSHSPVSYQFNESKKTRTPAILKTVMELLMEASRRHDEYYNRSSTAILLNTRLFLKSADSASDPVLAYFKEPRSIQEICELSPQDDMELSGKLLKLMEDKVLNPSYYPSVKVS